MNFVRETVLESFEDALKLLPILFIVYFLVEYLEHKNNNFVRNLFEKSRKTGPVLGALFGTIPQCGFSVVASELFSKRAITAGTLIAIFTATSDEAIPIMIAHPDRIKDMFLLILLKFIIAVLSGFIIDFAVRRDFTAEKNNDDTEHHFHGNCESCEGGILRSTVIHSVKIFAFIFAVNIILSVLTEFLSPLMNYLADNTILQVFLAPLFGIIPNCAASVVLTEMYLAENLSFSALCGGLCTGAGVGLLVLFRQNKNLKQNVTILGAVYIIGVIAGFALSAI